MKSFITFGDIVLVPIPWADKDIGVKIRPAVVISRENLLAAGQIIVLGVSSRKVLNNDEHRIVNWKESGLKLPSKVWLSKPYTATVKTAKKIGTLPPKELLTIYRQFLSYF